jgi:hypothetical protein
MSLHFSWGIPPHGLSTPPRPDSRSNSPLAYHFTNNRSAHRRTFNPNVLGCVMTDDPFACTEVAIDARLCFRLRSVLELMSLRFIQRDSDRCVGEISCDTPMHRRRTVGSAELCHGLERQAFVDFVRVDLGTDASRCEVPHPVRCEDGNARSFASPFDGAAASVGRGAFSRWMPPLRAHPFLFVPPHVAWITWHLSSARYAGRSASACWGLKRRHPVPRL